MNVLSLFDGMSCGQIALDRLGIEVDNYFASEIDKYAMEVAKKNYPKTHHIGCVKSVSGESLPKIDLLLGGSPCQGFSFAGKQLNFDDPRSLLFFEYVRLLKECKPKYFLLENVIMKKESRDVISEYLGVEPVKINSSLFSAQNRERYYWTNIPFTKEIKDKKIYLKDIVEDIQIESEGIDGLDFIGGLTNGLRLHDGKFYSRNFREGYRVYSFNGISCTLTKSSKGGKAGYSGLYGHTEKALDYMNRKVKGGRTHWDFGYIHSLEKEKSQCLVANIHKGVPYNVLVCSKPSPGEEKKDPVIFRKLTPVECERLQTVSDNYTEGVSSTQRYKMLGNGWTVDVIAHILSAME